MNKIDLDRRIAELRNHNKYDGLFIVVEGPDGGGKTAATQIVTETLKDLLPHRSVTQMRSLHSGPIREMILNNPMHQITEMLLATASHVENTLDKILPALKDGQIIVIDRYLDSMLAYQGYGRDQLQQVMWLQNQFLRALDADVWLNVTAPRELCRARIASRGQMDRLEKEQEEFHERVEAGYEEIYQRRRNADTGFRTHRLFNISTQEEFTQRCRDWTKALMESSAARQNPEDEIFIYEPIVIEPLTLQEYLLELRQRINVSYMPSSIRKDQRYHSKPSYVRSSYILNVESGPGYYKYTDDFYGNMVPEQELRALRKFFIPGNEEGFLPHKGIFFVAEFATRAERRVQILTQLDTGMTWVRNKQGHGQCGLWARWQDGSGLPLIISDVKETLDTYT